MASNDLEKAVSSLKLALNNDSEFNRLTCIFNSRTNTYGAQEEIDIYEKIKKIAEKGIPTTLIQGLVSLDTLYWVTGRIIEKENNMNEKEIEKEPETYDLLMISTMISSREKIIRDVTDYGIQPERGYFWFNKNGHRSFVPISGIVYFGNKADYKNECKELDKNNPESACCLCSANSITKKENILLNYMSQGDPLPVVCPKCLVELHNAGILL